MNTPQTPTSGSPASDLFACCTRCEHTLQCETQAECLNELHPAPGSQAAVTAGCTCPRMDNCHGNGFMGLRGIYVFNARCPLHGEKANVAGQATARIENPDNQNDER